MAPTSQAFEPVGTHVMSKAVSSRETLRRFTKDGWSYHMGYPADDRMISHAAKRNIELTSKSRPLVAQDMIDYDYIIAMDADNVAQIQLAADHWIVNMPESVPRDYRKKACTSQTYSILHVHLVAHLVAH